MGARKTPKAESDASREARKAMARARSSVEEVYAAAAASAAEEQRRRTARMLAVLGVDVLDADAESLPPALADHYLLLKREGLL